MSVTTHSRIQEALDGDKELSWTDSVTRSELISRIEPEVEIDNKTECWMWQAATARGYGKIRIGETVATVHRVTFRLAADGLDNDEQLNHECHRRACVNPRHVSIGTQAENMRQSILSGRYHRMQSPLSERDVRGIRERYADDSEDVSTRDLADDSGVSQRCICKIVNRKSWTHIE